MKLKRIFALLISVAIVFALFSGCRLKHYDKDEIAEWAQENINKPLYISSDYFERPSDDEGYTDRVWTAYLKDMPELKFEIISHEYWGMESVTHSIESTYGYVFGKYYFEKYCEENPTRFVPEYNEPVTYGYRLIADFKDRYDISDAINDAKSISEYMNKAGIGGFVGFMFEYDDVLSGVDDTDVFEYAGCDSDFSKINHTLTEELAFYAADYRLIPDQFTSEEMESAASALHGQFNITRADGTAVSYSDLALSRYGYGMSFGCMYEIFSREGFEVSGDTWHFSFKGIDGNNYEFSYGFNDYPFENGKNGYYYLKNGEKIPMDYYFYNHFRTHFIKEISGLSFEDI